VSVREGGSGQREQRDERKKEKRMQKKRHNLFVGNDFTFGVSEARHFDEGGRASEARAVGESQI